MSHTHDSATAVQLHRRASEARRLPGGDPWPNRIGEIDLDGRQLEAWAAAARHLADLDLCPIVPLPVLRAMCRCSDADRALATEIYSKGGVAA